MVGESHTCRACSARVTCDVPRWLCPWTNDDDDALCPDCLAAAFSQRPRSEDGEAPPLHVLIHTARTGGKTLRWIAARQYWKRIELYALRKVDAADALESLTPQRKASLRMILDVPRFGIHQRVQRPARYLAMLRHPVSRAISYHFYKGGADGRAFKVMRHMQDNAQTRSLAGIESCSQDPNRVTQSTFEQAIHHLRSHFDWIGVTERYDESLVLARRLLGWNRILHQPRNVSRRAPHEAFPPDTIRRIEDDNQFDLQLFALAQQWLTEAIAAEGPSFALELDAFQRLNAVHRRAIEVGDHPAPPPRDAYRAAIPDVVAGFRRDRAAAPDGPLDTAFRSLVTDLCR